MSSRPAAEEDKQRWRARWILLAGLFVLIQAGALAAMGHPLICECARIELWHGNPSGPETSQHVADWYTYTHVIHGFAFYLLLWLIAPQMPIGQRLALAIGIEAAWEVIENTPFVMDRYRQSALARGYFGDSIINSVFDTVAAAVGFVLARGLPVWLSITMIAASELFLAYMIRDNLLLNIIQLIYPNDWISNWQVEA
jgi:hypothetical protein